MLSSAGAFDFLTTRDTIDDYLHFLNPDPDASHLKIVLQTRRRYFPR